MADFNKPESREYIPLSFGTIIVTVWPDGRKSYQIKVDGMYRSPTPPENAEETTLKKWRDFAEYGQLRLYPSDALNLMDVAMSLRPDIVVSRR